MADLEVQEAAWAEAAVLTAGMAAEDVRNSYVQIECNICENRIAFFDADRQFLLSYQSHSMYHLCSTEV